MFPKRFLFGLFCSMGIKPTYTGSWAHPSINAISGVEAGRVSAFTLRCDKALDKKQPNGLLTWFSDSLRVAAPHEGEGNHKSVRHLDTWYSSKKKKNQSSDQKLGQPISPPNPPPVTHFFL